MMSLHTPASIWAKYKQPTLELASDGIGVSLDENTFLCIRWSAGLAAAQVRAWLAFFARSGVGPLEIADTLGIEPPGESSTVTSLNDLRTGLALLTRSTDQ